MLKKTFAVLLALLLLAAGISAALAEGEEIFIDAVHTSDEYKDMLMDSFDQTVLGKNTNVRQQLKKILYLDAITVDAAAYNRIITAVNEAIRTQSLSEGASIDSYTQADFDIAVNLISEICGALGLDFSIDPSNDSQNEYARVITIRKDGKVLGKINSDAKTGVANPASIVWIAVGGALLLLAFGLLIRQLTRKRSVRE